MDIRARVRSRSAKHFGLQVLLYLSLLSAILFVSPVLLAAIDGASRFDWPKLSNIGQSYTGVSALFSAAALFAVARSVRLQATEHELARHESVRELQFRLFEIGLQDVDLAETYAPIRSFGADSVYRKQMLFLAMRFNYLRHAYVVNEVSSKELMTVLRHETFPSHFAQEFWDRSRRIWLLGAEDYKVREFVDMVDSAYNHALSTNSHEDGDTTASKSQE